jgi:hypothetical protein
MLVIGLRSYLVIKVEKMLVEKKASCSTGFSHRFLAQSEEEIRQHKDSLFVILFECNLIFFDWL